MNEFRILTRFARQREWQRLGAWQRLAVVAALSAVLSGCGMSNMKDILTDKPEPPTQQPAAKPADTPPAAPARLPDQ